MPVPTVRGVTWCYMSALKGTGPVGDSLNVSTLHIIIPETHTHSVTQVTPPTVSLVIQNDGYDTYYYT
jgi:hypothetical protein